MFKPEDYKEVYGFSQFGSGGGFGIKILVACTAPIDYKEEKIHEVLSDSGDKILDIVLSTALHLDPEELKNAALVKSKLLALFPKPIYVEEIPNGYCSQYCCRHKPWFKVTSVVGHFVIGWRKSVINIDWSETRGTKSAAELFQNEPVTKGKKHIHAWSYEAAERYIVDIMGTAE